MKASEIRDMTAEELQDKLKTLKEELFNLRFQLAINQLDNPMRIKAQAQRCALAARQIPLQTA